MCCVVVTVRAVVMLLPSVNRVLVYSSQVLVSVLVVVDVDWVWRCRDFQGAGR